MCGVGRRNRFGPRTSELAGILGPFFVVAAAVAVVAVAAERVHWLLQRLFLFDGLWDWTFVGKWSPLTFLEADCSRHNFHVC